MTCVILHQICVNAIPFDSKLQSLLTPDLLLQLPDALLVCGALRLGCGIFGLRLPQGFLQLRRVQKIPPIHPVPESQMPVHPAYRQHQDFAVSPDNAVGFGERLRRAGSRGLAGRSWHTSRQWGELAVLCASRVESAPDTFDFEKTPGPLETKTPTLRIGRVGAGVTAGVTRLFSTARGVPW